MPETMKEKLTAVDKHLVETWHFRFEWGWAIFSVCNATGCFAIQSDWGDYAHRWNPSHLGGGQSLKQFLASGTNPHYIVNKLSYGQPRSFVEEFDGDATKQGLKKRLLEDRAEGLIFKETARDLWDDLNERVDFSSAEAFMWSVSSCEGLNSWAEDVGQWAVFRPSSRHEKLVHELIPLFQDFLRKEMEDDQQLMRIVREKVG